MIFSLCIFMFSVSLCLTQATFTVDIENGKIEGEESENYYAFKGIVYAQADRFELPTPYAEKWKDVRQFKAFGSECAQFEHFSYEFAGAEDCLSLNVFVPKSIVEADELAPVIFFIHGGAFMFGGSFFYEPDHVMNHEKIILVTINYRLGILGFLSTEDEVLPGNLGLKDQVAALKWVQRNIGAFNGDRNQVTIVGYSAGGASVHLHYMSDLSNGLFKNGISHSGVATNPWVMMENGRKKAHMVATFAKCPHNDHKEMIECLKRVPVEELMAITKKFQPFLYNPFSPFGVAVETRHKNAFISEHPQKILQNGKFKKLPWLLTQVKDEGSYPSAEFYRDENTLKEIDDRWEAIAPFLLDFYGLTNDEISRAEASRSIKKFYMKDEKISRKSFQSFNDIVTDRLFKSDAFEAIKLQSKFSPSYMYYFQFKSLSGLGEYSSNTTDNIGISHGEDVLLIFKTVIRKVSYSREETLMIKSLIDLWYNFATKNIPNFNGFEIEKSSSDDVKCLEIFSPSLFNMKSLDESFGQVNFWRQIERKLLSSSRVSDEL